MASPSRRDRLRVELLRCRDIAGLSGRKLGERLGVSQATISRIDRGETLPAMPLVRQWLDACGVDAVERERLLDLAEAAHGATRPWRELLAGKSHLQDDARRHEHDARLVRNFQPTVVAGLLQTPEYAAHLIPLADITGDVDHGTAVAGRL